MCWPLDGNGASERGQSLELRGPSGLAGVAATAAGVNRLNHEHRYRACALVAPVAQAKLPDVEGAPGAAQNLCSELLSHPENRGVKSITISEDFHSLFMDAKWLLEYRRALFRSSCGDSVLCASDSATVSRSNQ